MNKPLKARLWALETSNDGCEVIVIYNSLSGPDEPTQMPQIGETFGQYRDRIVADGVAKKLPHVIVCAWYGAENRPYNGDWLSGF